MAGGAETTRRDALKMAGASSVLLATLAAARPGSAAKVEPSNVLPEDHRPGLDEVAAFLGPAFAIGATLGTCRVVDVRPVVSGGIPITLQAPEGDQFLVDVVRFDPTEPHCGIGEVSTATVTLRNAGGATHEAHGLGAMAVARAVALRVREGAVQPASLMTMSERRAHDARG